MLFRDVRPKQTGGVGWVATSWVVFGLSLCLFGAALVLFIVVQGRVHQQAFPPQVYPAPSQSVPTSAATPSTSPSPGIYVPPAYPDGSTAVRGARNPQTGAYQDIEDDTPSTNSSGISTIVPKLPIPSPHPALPTPLPTPHLP
ncbi:MAG: hypothetical protein M3082_22170 [Candidatus Dormibacteraeota bacterium]|nr:hypothetical protein [Candidatus Dormibacteraeota bacterium]